MITFEGDWENPLSKILKESFDYPNEDLPEDLRKIEGMSGQKYRSFINKLIKNLDDARYLEIGCWKGSTICSALYNNKGSFTCIDNWSQFSGPKEDFKNNIKKYINDDTKFNFIESDFREVDYSNIGKFNVYFYDGDHQEKDQHDAVLITEKALDDCYILIVDDYDWLSVKKGTISGLNNSEQKIISSITINTDDIKKYEWHDLRNEWHNGYFIAVIEKQKIGNKND